tara:strand:+ start:2222 stop:2365 length:144 start_codon:yes stop_codon:yes gene_type:complete
MEDLKIEIMFLKNMIQLHNELGNKGLSKGFEIRLEKIIMEICELLEK